MRQPALDLLSDFRPPEEDDIRRTGAVIMTQCIWHIYELDKLPTICHKIVKWGKQKLAYQAANDFSPEIQKTESILSFKKKVELFLYFFLLLQFQIFLLHFLFAVSWY